MNLSITRRMLKQERNWAQPVGNIIELIHTYMSNNSVSLEAKKCRQVMVISDRYCVTGQWM
jgi:hypothetical protein